jgi:hypothetical protein
MSTYKELIYMCLDEIKQNSDDSFYTEDHVMFLLDKYRGLLLKQRYSDLKKPIPESNYQTLCLDLIKVPAISGEPCEGGYYLRSKEKIPFIIPVGITNVYPIDYYQGNITYVTRDRMKYIGHNKYLKNIIYSSIGPDNYLYLKSSNPQYLYLEKIRLTAIFENPKDAILLSCGGNKCNIYENEFPLEEALISTLIGLVVKDLLGASYRPEDDTNNAKDDLADLITFIRRNAKSNLTKAIEGDD